MYSIGIDLAEDTFAYCLYDAVTFTELETGQLLNEENGYSELCTVIQRHKLAFNQIVLFMEGTGGLENGVIQYFKNRVQQVYVLNPKQVKRFKECLFMDQKTDPVDASCLARMIVLPQIRNSHKVQMSDELILLQTCLSQREHMVSQRTRLLQRQRRLKMTGRKDSFIEQQVKTLLSLLSQQIREIEQHMGQQVKRVAELKDVYVLLQTIPGIGALSALTLLVYLGTDGSAFETAEKFAGYAGLYPCARSSGKMIGVAKLSQKGNRRIRTMLYLAGLSAISRPGKWRNYYLEKCAQGKKSKQVIMAVANRIASLSWTIVHNHTAFQEELFLPSYA